MFLQKKKCAVLVFHKDINRLYQTEWMNQFVDTILHQEKIHFDIFEVNYGNEDVFLFRDVDLKGKHFFFVQDFETHTEAMIFLLNKIFYDNDYDIAYNTNVDDFYETNRFYEQYMDIVQNGSLLNSTLFTQVKNNIPVLSFLFENNQFTWKPFDKTNVYKQNIPYTMIKKNILDNHNIVCHPSVCFTKEFWDSRDQFGNRLRYRNDKPYEDLSLWRRCVENNIKINILNKNLVWYRLHATSICSTKNQNLNSSTGPDTSDFNIGFFIKYTSTDSYSSILKIENAILCKKKKFYMISVQEDLVNEVVGFLRDNRVQHYKIVTSDFDVSKDLYRSCIEMNTDYFYPYEVIHFDYVFYTLIYCLPRAKFGFQEYIAFGKKLFKFLHHYTLIVFTDKLTLDILEKEFDFKNHTHVKIVLKELTEFEYQCDNVFQKNTHKKYFPHHDIDLNVIKIWINRHLLVEEVRQQLYSNFYCYIDWGYIRGNESTIDQFDSSHVDPQKIYFGLIKNNPQYIKSIINQIHDFNKEKIEKTLVNAELYTVGGGFSLIPFSKVSYWTRTFKSFFNTFIEKNIDFKDDQTIIRQIVFHPKEQNNFSLITASDWFPFIPFLKNNTSVLINQNVF